MCMFVIKGNPGKIISNLESQPMHLVMALCKYGSVTSTFYPSIEFTTFSFEAIWFLNFVSIFMSFPSQMPNGLFNVQRNMI